MEIESQHWGQGKLGWYGPYEKQIQAQIESQSKEFKYHIAKHLFQFQIYISYHWHPGHHLARF